MRIFVPLLGCLFLLCPSAGADHGLQATFASPPQIFGCGPVQAQAVYVEGSGVSQTWAFEVVGVVLVGSGCLSFRATCFATGNVEAGFSSTGCLSLEAPALSWSLSGTGHPHAALDPKDPRVPLERHTATMTLSFASGTSLRPGELDIVG